MRLTVRAFAKLNLTLEVLGRREDGYHEIATILQTVSLPDVLHFEQAETLSFACSDPWRFSPITSRTRPGCSDSRNAPPCWPSSLRTAPGRWPAGTRCWRSSGPNSTRRMPATR